jgi:Tol biopolymer transport system component
MALTAGTKLGPYEVAAPLGTGGMGEVYLARDTQLGREVAIKVLPESFAHDAERLSRFQREAKMLAALNHPNIATIYGLEHSGGVHCLVMELVAGDTLRERIAREGPLPVEEALGICRQIAEALEAAHEKGIIHRDLKPANVKLTPEGKVKVLDFGVAKASPGDTSSNDPATSPTLSAAVTLQGVILGTAAYMSPEQARGKAVDKRTDIWAFGCVLYELLSGRPAFDGEDVTEILAAVVKTEPDWNRLPRSTPPTIGVLLHRCLRKDRRQRLQDAADARIEIEDVLSGQAITEPTTSAMKGWRRAVPLSLVVAFGVCLAVVVGILVWILKPSPPTVQAPAHLVVAMPPGDRLQTTNLTLAVSPDGTQLAFVAIRGGVPQLYLRALDNPEAKSIPGTDGAFNPFFSPDGQWIGFFAERKMKKVSISRGAPQILCDAGRSRGATWGPDDTIIFSPSLSSGLWRVSASGGQPQMLTAPDASKSEYSHRYPQVLPGGKGVVFTALRGFGWDETQVEVLRLDTKERRVVIRGGHTGRFVTSGHLIYYRAGALLAVPFDLSRLKTMSTAPLTIADGVLQAGGTTVAAYSVSAAGTLAYLPAAAGSRQFEQRLVWVDRQGKIETLSGPPRAYGFPTISPDGKQAAVIITSSTEQVWIYDLARGTLTRLTSEPGSSRDPVWTPDGRRLAYRSNQAGIWNIYWRPADGSGSEERLTTSDNNNTPQSWSPDGKVLAFIEVNPTTGVDILTLPLEGDRRPQPFLRTSYNESAPAFSPDGQWLAYQSDESSGFQVYVQPYPGPGRKWQVSTEGGGFPKWNPNGRELFYRNGEKSMVVDVTTSPTFNAGKPRLLYEGPAGNPAPDGQRFLGIQAVEPEQPPMQIHVVLNLSEELKRRGAPGLK